MTVCLATCWLGVRAVINHIVDDKGTNWGELGGGEPCGIPLIKVTSRGDHLKARAFCFNAPLVVRSLPKPGQKISKLCNF